MKYSVLLVNAFFAVALAQKASDNNRYKDIQNVAQENVVEHDGTFKYGYENNDGTQQAQSGQLKYVDNKNAGTAAQGSFSFQVSGIESGVNFSLRIFF